MLFFCLYFQKSMNLWSRAEFFFFFNLQDATYLWVMESIPAFKKTGRIEYVLGYIICNKDEYSFMEHISCVYL